ncbi:ArsR/SmtB family transcription factor [Amycolatopsis albispora]|uniref:ArsR family transcriptional regulator n=1 Tax=Amycolatopsis albispora TaxID=1804986 RepID=A0A344L002_9PSEU|nr:metalloregulator ArsR/SmtB family transcription factor [Amycolatopsis albispora]AXB41376.1 ArsR family transcriptional regulator [Amycolatopsis albispora]
MSRAKTEQLQSALFEELARVAKALGNGKRLAIIDLLVQRPRGVVELAEAAKLNVTTASAHLQILKQVGLVTTVRDGTTVRHHIGSIDVAALYSQLLTVAAAQSAGVDTAARRALGTDDIEEIDRAELLRRVEAGQAIVVDVRPEVEFRAGHIPGAVSIPMSELPDRLDELSAEREIVVYCRGAYCAFSHDAVRLLTSNGYRAMRLNDGILEWRVAGEPLSVESSPG